MALFGNKKRITELEAELRAKEAAMTPEMRDVEEAQKRLGFLKGAIAATEETLAQKTRDIDQAIEDKRNELIRLNAEVEQKKSQIVSFDEMLLVQEFGLYEPRYDFATSTQYKDRLDEVRRQQKQMIKDGTACIGGENWTVNNSKAKGRKMIRDMKKLMLSVYNNDCENAIAKVTYSNFQASKKRIDKSFDTVCKLGEMMGVRLTAPYGALKYDELHLAFEFAQAKEREKEAKREAREREREEAKLRKEIEEQRKKLEKEKTQYDKALADIEKQLEDASDEDRAALEAKKQEIVESLGEIEKGIADVDYREANQRAGYVYVISNIGSFGEGVYKIGMTRRLDPMDRVHELGDASVPFGFDVHAMIFTDDAPGLEAALHNHFADRKVNLVNPRREFFRCSIDEIEAAIKANFDKTVEFDKVPDAEQYRISEKMRSIGNC